MDAPFRIELPARLDYSALTEGLLPAAAWDPGVKRYELCCVEPPILHVEPGALAMLAAWAASCRARGAKLVLGWGLSSPYTYKAGLLHALMESAPGAPTGCLSRLLTARHLREESEKRLLFQTLASTLRLGELEHHSAPFTLALSEALNNVFEHSVRRSDSAIPEVPGCFVSAVFFPSTQRVTLAVVDLGRGIPQALRQRFTSLEEDGAALARAVEPYVSGAVGRAGDGARVGGTSTNAGLGLFVIRNIAARSEGHLTIFSGHGLLRASDIERTEVRRRETPWPGTALIVTFLPERAAQAGTNVRQWISVGTRSGPKYEVTSWGSGPPHAVVCSIPASEGGFVEDKLFAIALQTEQILPAIRVGRAVCLDFGDALLGSHSCIHALLYQAIRDAGPGRSSKDLIHIRTHKDARQLKEVIRLVGYMAREGLAGSGGAEGEPPSTPPLSTAP